MASLDKYALVESTLCCDVQHEIAAKISVFSQMLSSMTSQWTGLLEGIVSDLCAGGYAL